MTLRTYQTPFLLSHLYKIKMFGGGSGLGETISPRITSVGGIVDVYGSEDEPTGLTLANLATKMALMKSGVALESFNSLPNYIAVIQKTGTSTELVLTSIQIEEDVQVIA